MNGGQRPRGHQLTAMKWRGPYSSRLNTCVRKAVRDETRDSPSLPFNRWLRLRFDRIEKSERARFVAIADIFASRRWSNAI